MKYCAFISFVLTLISVADRRVQVMRDGIAAALGALANTSDRSVQEASLRLLALLTAEDGAEHAVMQLGGVLHIAAALQVDDKAIIKYSMRSLRNVTVSEGAIVYVCILPNLLFIRLRAGAGGTKCYWVGCEQSNETTCSWNSRVRCG